MRQLLFQVLEQSREQIAHPVASTCYAYKVLFFLFYTGVK